ncbi:DUF1772 domain-containing protein [Litoreibacter janthinus]|uniref:Uncharacterized membrane protein n=1 Tax=Litoreibacter janthinus TaxID=670154 RepID=A0A1I6GD22_9RHOB|nr:anthrone oxygenase family protein [Litoreibacter janthinus]SFR40040.1 Uncharacterized membrane protein [Litoreibacter janthinus]
MPRTSLFLCLVPLVLFGAIGGFFYAYSVSVMQGLNNLSDSAAIQAMQELNRGTRNAVFLVTFLFTPIVSVLCAAVLYWKGDRATGVLLLAASAVYFLGSFLPTVNINVPLNHEIEALNATMLSSSEAASVWAEYSATWTYWNTIRAVMALIGLALAGSAVYALKRQPAPVAVGA